MEDSAPGSLEPGFGYVYVIASVLLRISAFQGGLRLRTQDSRTSDMLNLVYFSVF